MDLILVHGIGEAFLLFALSPQRWTVGSMTHMKLTLPLLAAGLLAACAQTGSSAVQAGDQPVELGLVHWERDFELATARAREESRDVLLVFQEVPG